MDSGRGGPALRDSPASPFTALDPSIAKQMAAISQYSHARSALSGNTNILPPRPIANGALSGTTANNSGFSGQMTSPNDSISSNQAQHSQDDMQSANERKMRTWYNSIVQFMASRGTPLPPSLTGVPWPQGYDPTTSPFKGIEAGAEPYSFRLAGKDVNLFRFWTTIMSAGGASKASAISQMSGWPNILQVLELPTEMPNPQNPSAMTSVLPPLVRHYQLLLHPFTEWWFRNLQDNQRKAMAARQLQQANNNNVDSATASTTPVIPASTPTIDPVSAVATPTTSAPKAEPAPTQPPPQHTTEPSAAKVKPDTPSEPDSDARDLKRKNEEGEKSEPKRARTESNPPEPKPPGSDEASSQNPAHPSTTTSNKTEATATLPSSIRKIEYVPLVREVDTHGGRNLQLIEAELNKATRRPLRDHNDWGSIDIDHLILNIRSRIPTELSYALTTLTLLSTMRGQTPGSGFPIHNCGELFDEVLDLIEDEAFGESPDHGDIGDEVLTKHSLAKTFQEAEHSPFAALNPVKQGNQSKGGPRQSAVALVKAAMNIVRNLSVIADNQGWLGKNRRMLDVVLRVSSVTKGKDGLPQPSSPILSLGDVLSLRKDALNILSNVAPQIMLAHMPPVIVRRAFKLIASYLVDPMEAVTPIRCVHLSGIPPQLPTAPMKLPDLALEAFTRLSGPDIHRQVLSRVIPTAQLWQLIEALVHRLPVDDDDFQLCTREVWLCYIEKTVFSLYSLFFLAPPSLKKKVKEDKSLGVVKIMQRMVTKFMLASSEARQWYHFCAKRTIETLKVLDDGEDSFTTPTNAVSSVLSFGVGYGEGETAVEKGTGLWGGAWNATWELLMLRDLDGETFGELDSLLRVEVASAA